MEEKIKEARKKLLIIMTPMLVLMLPLAIAIDNTAPQTDMYEQALLLVDFEVNQTFDNSSHNRAGIITGSPQYLISADCPVGNRCMNWDSTFTPTDDYLKWENNETGDDTHFTTYTNISVSCWTNISNKVNSGWASNTNDDGTGFDAGSGQFRVFDVGATGIRTSYIGQGGSLQVTSNDPRISNDHWRMITSTVEWNASSGNNGNITLYVNGTQIGSDYQTTIFANIVEDQGGRRPWSLGRVDNEHADGLDHCVVFNYTLNQKSVQHLYDITSQGQALTSSSQPQPPAPEDNNVSTSVTVLLNATAQDIVLLETETFNVSYLEINGTAVFTRNGTVITNNSVQSLGVGVYNFTAYIAPTDSIFTSRDTRIATVIEVIVPTVEEAESSVFFNTIAGVAVGGLLLGVIVIGTCRKLIKDLRGKR